MATKKRTLSEDLDPRVELIFKIMEKKNISNKEMAGFIGCSESRLSEWGKGRSKPSAEVMPAIADFLDCSLDYLMCRTDNPLSHKIPFAESVNYINGGTINGGSQNQISINSVQLDSHKKLLLDLYDKLSPAEQVQLIVDISERVKNNAANS